MVDAQLQSSPQSLDQLIIEEDCEIEYLKKEQELEKLKAMYDKETKCYIDLSLEKNKLKERNKELENDRDQLRKMQLPDLPAGNRTRVLWITRPGLYHWALKAIFWNYILVHIWENDVIWY